jgi:molecular chaperone IbpA
MFGSLFDDFRKYDPFMIGFNDIWTDLGRKVETVAKNVATYPPFNVKKVDENKYVLEMAVAGFGKNNLDIELDSGTLRIKGSVESEQVPDEQNYLYKGIAERAFTRTFQLADNVEIKNADLFNGMLKIWLEKFIPESAKPKKVSINEPSAEAFGVSKKKDTRELLTE